MPRSNLQRRPPKPPRSASCRVSKGGSELFAKSNMNFPLFLSGAARDKENSKAVEKDSKAKKMKVLVDSDMAVEPAADAPKAAAVAKGKRKSAAAAVAVPPQASDAEADEAKPKKAKGAAKTANVAVAACEVEPAAAEVGSGRQVAQGKVYKEKSSSRARTSDFIAIVEEAMCDTEAQAMEQTAGKGAKRRSIA